MRRIGRRAAADERSVRRTSAMIVGTAMLALVGCGDDAPRRAADPLVAATAIESAVDLVVVGCRVEPVRGAGSVIADGSGNHYVLTAAHVVAGSTSIVVTNRAEGVVAVGGVLVAMDPVNDLALLRTSLDVPALPIGSALLDAGDDGAAVVFRDGRAVAAPFSIVNRANVGILDIFGDDKVNRSGYRIDVDVEHGDSGAVLVDADGRAAGVLYARSQTTDGQAFASDTTALAELLATAAEPDRAVDTGRCATP